MPSYTFPANSFVQPASVVTNACRENVSLCLPVYDVNDVAFQFIDNTAAVDYYSVGIIVDGVLVGSYVNIPKVNIGSPNNLVYMPSLPASLSGVAEGQCFVLAVRAQIKDAGAVNLFQTNCFIKSANKCYTSRITYACDEDSFGFIYTEDYAIGMTRYDMYQVIRLPFHLKAPQFPVKRNVFMKSNGERKKLSARVSNEYVCDVDYMPKDWHEKLVVAIEHDLVEIENVDSGYTTQRFSHEGSYEIDWQAFLNYPTAPAKFKLFKTPYNKTNSNCN
jgi:hypothetical protein